MQGPQRLGREVVSDRRNDSHLVRPKVCPQPGVDGVPSDGPHAHQAVPTHYIINGELSEAHDERDTHAEEAAMENSAIDKW